MIMPFVLAIKDYNLEDTVVLVLSSDHDVTETVLAFWMTLAQPFAHLVTAQVILAHLYYHL